MVMRGISDVGGIEAGPGVEDGGVVGDVVVMVGRLGPIAYAVGSPRANAQFPVESAPLAGAGPFAAECRALSTVGMVDM